MADIIEKIGKYFADQEAQMRDMYVHAAAAAAATSARAKSASIGPQQPPRRDETDGKSVPRGRRASASRDERPASLLRRRLSLPERETEVAGAGVRSDSGGAAERRATSHVASVVKPLSAVGEGNAHRATKVEDSPPCDHPLSKPTATTPKLTKKKTRRKKAERSNNATDHDAGREKAQQHAVDGLAKAQERARRIQQEKMAAERQQQSEREATAARMQEEMRKIEQIRRKGKQFAMRLRPQSAPTTPQPTRTPARFSETEMETSQAWTRARDEEEGEPPNNQDRSTPQRRYLDELERQMRAQMSVELHANEQLFTAAAQDEQEWSRLEAQHRKAVERNAVKQERVHSLKQSNLAVKKEIHEHLAEAQAVRQERLRLEEKSKRERQLKQREAERELHARLRREETQRIAEEERTQSDVAAEARAKAKLRVHSRAALLKRVLHGCDIRSENASSSVSRNQEESSELVRRHGGTEKPVVSFENAPELAEFEEDGLATVDRGTVPASPTRLARPQPFQSSAFCTQNPTFTWQVPVLTDHQIYGILLDELGNLADQE